MQSSLQGTGGKASLQRATPGLQAWVSERLAGTYSWAERWTRGTARPSRAEALGGLRLGLAAGASWGLESQQRSEGGAR